MAIKPTDEEIASLSSGNLREERHCSEAQNRLGAALWLDHKYSQHETNEMLLALDLVPDTIIEAVAQDITAHETRPFNRATFRLVATKCWVAMLATKDLERVLTERGLKQRQDLDDSDEASVG